MVLVVLCAVLSPGSLTASGDSSPKPADGRFPPLSFSASEVSLGSNRIDDLTIKLESNGGFRVSAAWWPGSEQLNSPHSLELNGVVSDWVNGENGLSANGLAAYRSTSARWRYTGTAEGFEACVETRLADLETGVRLMWPEHGSAWVRSGDLESCLRWNTGEAGGTARRVDVSLRRLSFDSPDGRFAGEGLSLDIEADLERTEPLRLTAGGQVKSGQVLIDQFYGDFDRSPLRFHLVPELGEPGALRLGLNIRDDGAVHVDANLTLADSGHWALQLQQVDLTFPGAYRRYLEPFAASFMLDGLEVTGSARWSGALSSSGLESGDLDISDLTVVDVQRGRFALTGLATRLRPGDVNSQSAVGWSGLLLGPVNLGPGSALLDTTPGAFALASPLQLDVLGGQILFDRLRYAMPGSPAVLEQGSRFEMQATLTDIDVARLTRALDWPHFDGKLSGSIPSVRLDEGVLRADGQMRFEVFDGEITVDGLSAERLFGVLPSLAADVEIRGLDLEPLTRAFEFGTIGGRLDGRVEALRLLDWRPVSFSAWLGTPESQQKSRSISRRAVQNLTAIGGGTSTAALSSPLLRMFSSFSYRRLGLGCRLENYVCHVSGLQDDGESVLLLEGSGLPRITVRAWNRSVDWPRMVENLLNLSGEPEVQRGGAPRP